MHKRWDENLSWYEDLWSEVKNCLKILLQDRIKPPHDQESIHDGNAVWTNALLDALTEIGQARRSEAGRKLWLYPRRRHLDADENDRANKPKQLQFDLTWWAAGTSPQWWDASASEPLDLILAVESEWDASLEQIANDYMKLLHCHAEHRLLLACATPSDKGNLVDVLIRLRDRSKLHRYDVCVLLWDRSAGWNQVASPTILYP